MLAKLMLLVMILHERGSAVLERIAQNIDVGRRMAQSHPAVQAQPVMDNRGQVASGAMQAVSLVVALMVAALVAAFLLPIGITEIVSVETTDWGEGASAMWEILDVIIVLAVFLFFIGVALSAANRV